MTEQKPPNSSASAAPPATIDAHNAHAYWRANLRLIAALLTVWFTVSFGFGILLVDGLNRFTVFGFKLGFWWAQQGSIFVFVVLIFVYAALMARLDERFGVSDSSEQER
jgi:putative solute:sodium symporter small subunit